MYRVYKSEEGKEILELFKISLYSFDNYNFFIFQLKFLTRLINYV